MSRAPQTGHGGVPWGRVAAVAGGIVVLRGLLAGASRALSFATAEVEYRIGGDSWSGLKAVGRR